MCIKQENNQFHEIPDWSKLFRGRGLENAGELLTCKCSFSSYKEQTL